MLESIDLFSSLSNAELQKVSSITVPVNANRGEVIFKQGDFSRDFYIIQTGQVEISVRDIFNAKKVVSILKNGDFFGEMALFDKDSARSAGAAATQNCQLLKIPGQEFERLLRDKPGISFKLLGALSKRLKEANVRRNTPERTALDKEGKVITVSSARSGYGKTTFATTLACLLAAELPRKVLFIDLDLYFGDGTMVMGVFSPRSIMQLIDGIRAGVNTQEGLMKFLVKHTENLHSLPAPHDFLEGEKVKPDDLVQVLKICRKFYDYIVIDTSSHMTDVYLTALDMADHIFFLVDIRNAMAIKSNAVFFQGLNHLNLAENRVNLVGSQADSPEVLTKMRKLFKFRVVGGLPTEKDFSLEHGKTLYQRAPDSQYCEMVRGLTRSVLGEDDLKQKTDSGFLYRFLFSSKEMEKQKGEVPPPQPGIPGTVDPVLKEGSYQALIKFIRQNITSGNLDKAFGDSLRLLDMVQDSSILYQLLGEAAFFKNDLSVAVDAMKKAVDLDPENHMALGFLSTITGDETMRQKGLDILQKKMNGQTSFPDLLNDQGRLHALFQKHEEACTFFTAALEKNPKYAEARINLAISLGELHRFDDGIKHLFQIEPKTIRVMYLLGSYFSSTGRFFYALRAFTLVSEINPNYCDVGERLESLRHYFQRLDNLLSMHKEIMEAHPTYPDLHFKVAHLYELSGNREQAIFHFKEALRLNPTYQEATTHLEGIQHSTDMGIPQLVGLSSSFAAGGATPKSLTFDVTFEKLGQAVEQTEGRESFELSLKNLRNNKIVTETLSMEAFRKGRVTIDTTPLGQLYAQDLLLIQLLAKGSREILATLPHVLTDKDIESGHVLQDLSMERMPLWHYPFAAESPFQMPVRNFHVAVHSPSLVKATRGNGAAFKVEMENFNTASRTQASFDSEDPSIVHFVFQAEGKDVVREGDNLHLKVSDEQGTEVFGMDFPILKEDVEAFSKSIALEMLGLMLPDSKAKTAEK